ncbi:MAG: MarR family winged helix-turn-helix transcriptional regulator [Devosia sp.]
MHGMVVDTDMTADWAKTGESEPKTAGLVPDQDRAAYERMGFSAEAASAIVRIDQAMSRIRRSMQKREKVTEIIRELDPELDLPRLDVIVAVMHWHPESAEDATREVTVGTVAERLGVDPSRASRLVSDVIEMGYIRRAASQADSRRIVLEPTDKGTALAAAFRERKSAAMARGLANWNEAELEVFAGLIERFTLWSKPSPVTPADGQPSKDQKSR